ncbi:uncharacterized protein LOC105446070 [Strongylocentrotus purpuratus]|uniref:Uncharacterized protein n=1 Tax=Strongylocentrotus purpuratus TaxID=7668 RepID=A0A7M7NS04_STRPU|nr:uncharacterized protein LOC105446070 [Strongylocentrotus purpuratus]
MDYQIRYLYWSRHEGIDRKLLNGTDKEGGIEEVIQLQMFSKMNGLTINPDGTRLFFCDENSKQALYLDIGSSSAVVLIREYELRDVSMDGNGVLYWLESGEKLILVMDDYELSTDFNIEEEGQFNNPQRIHIALVNS